MFMKTRILLVTLMVTMTFCVNAQENLLQASINQDATPIAFKEVYSTKMYGYDATSLNEALKLASDPHPMEKIGKTLTFIGLPLAVIGGAMVSQADALYYECVNGVCDGDPNGGFGVIFLAAGIGLSGTGIVLWSIGRSKR